MWILEFGPIDSNQHISLEPTSIPFSSSYAQNDTKGLFWADTRGWTDTAASPRRCKSLPVIPRSPASLSAIRILQLHFCISATFHFYSSVACWPIIDLLF